MSNLLEQLTSQFQNLQNSAEEYEYYKRIMANKLKSINYKPKNPLKNVFDNTFDLIDEYDSLKNINIVVAPRDSRVIYKLLNKQRVDGELVLCSVNQHIHGTKWCTVYKPKEITYPNVSGTKLFGFATKDDAVRFQQTQFITCAMELWICEATNVEKVERLSSPSDNYIALFWEKILGKNKEMFVPSMNAPIGTLQCDSIKLVEKLAL